MAVASTENTASTEFGVPHTGQMRGDQRAGCEGTPWDGDQPEQAEDRRAKATEPELDQQRDADIREADARDA